MENLIYAMADMVSLMKTMAPMELWIVILGGVISFLIMEYTDRKRLRHENNQTKYGRTNTSAERTKT